MSEKRSGRVTILHTNDIHGRTRAFPLLRGSATSQTGDPGQEWDEFERQGEAGGFASLATAVRRLRAERGPENVVLVDGGDTFSDDYLGNQTRGEAVIRCMSALGCQLMALGNHDFDYGLERTRELEQLGGFPMRAANVLEKATGQPVFGDPTLVLEAGGLRLGFLTLGYPNTGQTGSRDNLEPLEFTDGIQAVREYLPELQEKSDLVVVLSHMGTALDRLLAQEVPELPLIIGAHSHDRLAPEDPEPGGPIIVQAGSDGFVLGETVIEVQEGRVGRLESRLHTLWTDEYPPDEEMAALVEALRLPFRAELEEIIAAAAAPIGRNYRSESPFDQLAGEILCQEMDAEIAFLPGVGYGVTLPPGPVSREAFYTLLPHPAPVVTLEMTGAQVLEVLEQSATNQKPGDVRQIVGGLVQTAGLRWTVDYAQEAGRRVSGVLVNGQPLEPERWYRAATNGGMLNGLHNYTAFAAGRSIRRHDIQLNELVETGLRRRATLVPPEPGQVTLRGGEAG